MREIGMEEAKAMEKDRSKKRDDPGGKSSAAGMNASRPKVEKRRRLVLSDSDSDEVPSSSGGVGVATKGRILGERAGREGGRSGWVGDRGMDSTKPRGKHEDVIRRKVLEHLHEKKRNSEPSEDDRDAKRSKGYEGSAKERKHVSLEVKDGVRKDSDAKITKGFEGSDKERKHGSLEVKDEERNVKETAPVRKLNIPAYRLKDATIKGVIVPITDKHSKLGRDPHHPRERFGPKIVERPKFEDRYSASEKKKESLSNHATVRVQGKSGVLQVFLGDKKIEGSEKEKKISEENKQSRQVPSISSDGQGVCPPSPPSEKRALDKASSNIASTNGLKGITSDESNLPSKSTKTEEEKEGKSTPPDVQVEKHLPEERKKEAHNKVRSDKNMLRVEKAGKSKTQEGKYDKLRSYDTKKDKLRSSDANNEKFSNREAKTLRTRPGENREKIRSQEAKSSHSRSSNVSSEVQNSKGKSSVKISRQYKKKSSMKTTLQDKGCMEGGKQGRREIKQMISQRIKSLLLASGWRIELKPRKGRDYEDAVYVPPQGGGGYWSVTKAYAVFQRQQKEKQPENGQTSEEIPDDNVQGETLLPGLAISNDDLALLKKNIVKKRENKIEAEGTRKRGKDSRKKKKVKGADKKRKVGNFVESSEKHLTPTQKLHLQRSDTKPRGRAILIRGANKEDDAESDGYVPYVWKRTILSWMIDLGIVPANGRVNYMNKKRTKIMMKGRVTRDGIKCGCCSKILTVSRFEVHAGSKVGQPYENIFVEKTEISLLQSQLNAWEKHEESTRRTFCSLHYAGDDPNDDTCGICGDGGDLMCCDSCPSTFHLTCLDIQMLPPGDWLCMHCRCKYCGLSPSKTATEECEAPVYQLLSCSQCEEKYHQECISESSAIPINSDTKQLLFCGRSCWEVFKGLQKLIGAKNELDGRFSWRLIHRLDEDSTNLEYSLPLRALCNSKVAVAFTVMDECFYPIVDQRSEINLIHNVLYSCGSNFKRLDYKGFYSFILERGDETISVASVRIHGTRLAEMPFIGTRNMYRRQGMCRLLLKGIETALCSLRIEKLMIPAISELTSTWTTSFGFRPLPSSQKQESMTTNMLVFPGTGLLEKVLPVSTMPSEFEDGASVAEVEIRSSNILEVTKRASSPSISINACDSLVIVSPAIGSDIPPNDEDRDPICGNTNLTENKSSSLPLNESRSSSKCVVDDCGESNQAVNTENNQAVNAETSPLTFGDNLDRDTSPNIATFRDTEQHSALGPSMNPSNHLAVGTSTCIIPEVESEAAPLEATHDNFPQVSQLPGKLVQQDSFIVHRDEGFKDLPGTSINGSFHPNCSHSLEPTAQATVEITDLARNAVSESGFSSIDGKDCELHNAEADCNGASLMISSKYDSYLANGTVSSLVGQSDLRTSTLSVPVTGEACTPEPFGSVATSSEYLTPMVDFDPQAHDIALLDESASFPTMQGSIFTISANTPVQFSSACTGSACANGISELVDGFKNEVSLASGCDSAPDN